MEKKREPNCPRGGKDGRGIVWGEKMIGRELYGVKNDGREIVWGG